MMKPENRTAIKATPRPTLGVAPGCAKFQLKGGELGAPLQIVLLKDSLDFTGFLQTRVLTRVI